MSFYLASIGRQRKIIDAWVLTRNLHSIKNVLCCLPRRITPTGMPHTRRYTNVHTVHTYTAAQRIACLIYLAFDSNGSIRGGVHPSPISVTTHTWGSSHFIKYTECLHVRCLMNRRIFALAEVALPSRTASSEVLWWRRAFEKCRER